MVSIDGKGKASAVATWPSPSNLNVISPRKLTNRPKLAQSVLLQPQMTHYNSQISNNIPLAEGDARNGNHSSNTWTSSSENPDLPEDGKDGREHFVIEYNRLAQRHGIRPIVPGDFSPLADNADNALGSRRSSWLFKKIRQGSGQLEQTATKPENKSSRHQRRPSEVALDFVHGSKRDGLKNQDLKDLVRFCGRSPLFLPTDYAPFSLTLPTCLRALAQALIQHDTKGLFRVPGSARVINALYDYYCPDDDTDAISTTTRCPTLPSHIRCNAHDIASTFKRFLAGLPGGILGSLSLFDALVAIHTQLQGDPEWHWTKESKLRARLIALAIGTVKSQYQRELICAVFGLLCLVGRVAKNTPREDENGRPLPTSDLMGYNSLGIIFGPLLIGDMIDSYSMKVADPSAGLLLLPVSPPRSKKERRKHRRKHKTRHKQAERPDSNAVSSFTVDKIHIANGITEMLIVHWREVVRHIRSTGSVRNRRSASNAQYLEGAPTNMPSSVSENFGFHNPSRWDHPRRGSATPSTPSPIPTLRTSPATTIDRQDTPFSQQAPHIRQASISSSGSTQKPSTRGPLHPLSPTIEESPSPRGKVPKFSHDYRDITTRNVSSNLPQKAYTGSSVTVPGPVHDTTSKGSLSGSVVVLYQSAEDANTTASAFSSQGAQKPEFSSSSPSIIRQDKSRIIPHSDMVVSDSSKTEHEHEDINIVDSMTTPSAMIDKTISGPGLHPPQTTRREEHNEESSSHQFLPYTAMANREAEISRMNLNDAVIDGAGQSHTEIDRTTAPRKTSPLGLLYSTQGGKSEDGHLPRSITDPGLYEKDHALPALLPDLDYLPSEIRNTINHEGEALMSSVDHWRSLVASSKASSESLAKSAKERRLKRTSGNTSSRSSRESSDVAKPRPTTPRRKQQQLIHKSGGPSGKGGTAWSERKVVIPEKTPQSLHPTLKARAERFSPDKGKPSCETPAPQKRRPRRSVSKPAPGAVKAMAALFDSAAKESPDKPATILSGRSRKSLRASDNLPFRGALDGSPTKSRGFGGAQSPAKSPIPVNSHSRANPHSSKGPEPLSPDNHPPAPGSPDTVRASPSRPSTGDTPTKSLRDTLRPVSALSPSKKEPSPPPPKPGHDLDLSQPPKLGTMVPHEEEPAVGRFLRPSSSSTSAASRTVSALSTSEPPFLPQRCPDSRHAPFLHAQIRALQRQAELRSEEMAQLRAQLETLGQLDIGTLCEELRKVRRECAMWRKRAETAERRLAVFQRFGERFKVLTDGGGDCDCDCGEGEEAPSCSVSREVFKANRFRTGFMGQLRRAEGGGDEAVFDGFSEVREVRETDGVCEGREYELRRGRNRSRRTADVEAWETPRGMLDFRHGVGTTGMRL